MSFDTAYDELLVLRCQDGDAPALDELVDRWQGRFVGHACRLTGQPEAARDAVQEAWLAIVRGLGRLDDPARFGPWAYRIVGNKAIDWIRRQGRRRRVDQELVDEQRREEDLSRRESSEDLEHELLVQALRSLSPARQALLALFYQDGLSVREIADILEIPAGTVKSRLFHARNRLKEALEGGNHERAR